MICRRRLDEVLEDRDHCLEIGHRASTAVAGGECGPEVVLADRLAGGIVRADLDSLLLRRDRSIEVRLGPSQEMTVEQADSEVRQV